MKPTDNLGFVHNKTLCFVLKTTYAIHESHDYLGKRQNTLPVVKNDIN